MNMLNFLQLFPLQCPQCSAELDLLEEITESERNRPDAIMELRTTITPLFKCKQCDSKYFANIILTRKINLEIKCQGILNDKI
jgi:uncharacterized Zn finger protein